MKDPRTIKVFGKTIRMNFAVKTFMTIIAIPVLLYFFIFETIPEEISDVWSNKYNR